jgi:hypothetical protein
VAESEPGHRPVIRQHHEEQRAEAAVRHEPRDTDAGHAGEAHEAADDAELPDLPSPGIIKWRKAGEFHDMNKPIVDALQLGANVVITGRSTDTALTMAPLVHEFGWTVNDWNPLASGIVAGHIIECGAQCSGGNCLFDWRDIPNLADVGYPIVEAREDGSFYITKHPNTGGRISRHTVIEQLVVRDDLIAERERIEGELRELEQDADRLRGRIAELTGEIDRELGTELEKRSAILPQVPEDVVELYESLRTQKRGIGVGALEGGICTACREALSAVEVDRIRRAAREGERRFRCEHCRRILVVQ